MTPNAPQLTIEDLRSTAGMSCLFLLRDGTVGFLTHSTISHFNIAMCTVQKNEETLAIQPLCAVENYGDRLSTKNFYRYDIMAYIRMSSPTEVLTCIMNGGTSLTFNMEEAEWTRPPMIVDMAKINCAFGQFVDGIRFDCFTVWANNVIEYDGAELDAVEQSSTSSISTNTDCTATFDEQ